MVIPMKKEYLPRLIDKKVKDYLTIFGAISIEGPKWCGKTWTSLNHAKTATYMDDNNNKEIASLDAKTILNTNEEEFPQLIDEWHLVPTIWDAVRRECDKLSTKGNYILTGSTTLQKEKDKQKIHHSGIGRIGKIKMYTMSLYESKDSTGKASLSAMLNNEQENTKNKEIEILDIAHLIIRGGWPENINVKKEQAGIIPKSYIDSILDIDMNEDSPKRRDKNKMKMLLRSLSRNEATIVGNKTILKDIEEFETEEDILSSRDTILEYLDVLERLYLIENQNAYNENYRSKERLGKSPKRHLIDPSLACACLDLTEEKLLKDLKTFGFLFESLVERDLRIYMNYLDGNLYHFRDNVSGLEIDAILEFRNGDYAAVEIKLGLNEVNAAKKNLLTFYNNTIKKPKFMCIIIGNCNAIVKDPETNIYLVPITALKP